MHRMKTPVYPARFIEKDITSIDDVIRLKYVWPNVRT